MVMPRLLPAALLLIFMTGCSEVQAPLPPGGLAASISAAEVAAPEFYFPATPRAGEFTAGLGPVVQICAYAASWTEGAASRGRLRAPSHSWPTCTSAPAD
jgi:hypothetical protein